MAVEIATTPCTDRGCPCIEHGTREFDFDVIAAAGIDWQTPSPGQPPLSPNDAKLLVLLLEAPIVRCEDLLRWVWGPEYRINEDVVRPMMHCATGQLRQKLGSAWQLQGIRFVGYRLRRASETQWRDVRQQPARRTVDRWTLGQCRICQQSDVAVRYAWLKEPLRLKSYPRDAPVLTAYACAPCLSETGG